MTQMFVASTFFGAMSLAAAVDSGEFGPAGDRRILLVSDNAALLEITDPLMEAPGFEAVRSRFDEVVSWNELLWPFHPSTWQPRPQDVLLLRRLLASYWSLDDSPLQIVVESVQVPPAKSLAAIFEDASITVYSDGLMSYGPTRNSQPREVATRIDRLVYLDLVPGVEPLLLDEYDVARSPLPLEAFRAVVSEVADSLDRLLKPRLDEGIEEAPLLLGQYLSALDLISPQQEDELHASMVRAMAARGHRTVLFKPHPSNTRRTHLRMSRTAQELDVRLVLLEEPIPAEVWFTVLRPSTVVSCFSTGLSTAAHLYGIPVACVGTEMLLEAVTPYQNSNRIPVTIVDASMPRIDAEGGLRPPRFSEERLHRELAPLLRTVSYCMQGAAYPHLREAAVDYLGAHYDATTRRYFKRRRLTALHLPGALPQRSSTNWLVSGARKVRSVQQTVFDRKD
ncbi:hypothetical protein HDA32_004822 [Spinactinospora alkalitolerans]|uniref:Uncharacterized protein n=1 Tax=Spinactinospora alkalitolerans TaxID=687207 RepID=A0A852U2P3_9ACTN|nr:alpha-2,8-polysialyltransferase family protein [Spinactinospora alkalitolerans]NYE49702.1 hypothetical protein [Spinactinospora alkalitolerans]